MTARTSDYHGLHSTPHGNTPHGHGGHVSHTPQKPGHRPHARRPKAEPRRSPWPWIAAAVVLVAAGVGGWLVAQSANQAEALDLVDQMVLAAEGKAESNRHILGGRLYTKREGDQIIVVADGLPQKDCAQAGWTLMRRGIITINGSTPHRVSAGVVADLCAKADDGAKLEWAPKQPD